MLTRAMTQLQTELQQMTQAGGEPDGLDHGLGVGAPLAGLAEGRAVVHGGADDGQPQGDVHPVHEV